MLSRRWRILLAYNLPWALWTLYALLGPGVGVSWRCPWDAVLPWCPGCGLTSAYRELLHGQSVGTWRLWLVLALFVINAVASVRRAAGARDHAAARRQTVEGRGHVGA